MRETHITSWAEPPPSGSAPWSTHLSSWVWLILVDNNLNLMFEIPSIGSCLSHLSPCRDKTPSEGSLKEEGLMVAHRPRGTACHGGEVRQQEPEATASATPTVRKQRWMLILTHFLLCIWSGTPGMELPVSRMGPPSLGSLFQIPHKRTQRCVS